VSKPRVVVVEDEPAIRRGVADALRLTGYDVGEAADGAAGLVAASADGVDLVLLDLLLPKRDGLAVLAELRKTHPARPVIILTARGTEDDRVRGLKLGADDYVVKPFSARELLARVEAVLRRTTRKSETILAALVPGGVVDLARREVRWDAGERVDLSETEAAIVTLLLEHRDRAVSREEILGRVWGIATDRLETRTVDMHVARLRAKLQRDGDGPEVISTVRSHGYKSGPGLTLSEPPA
jgi:DNA-binding response OmpR family regulator